MHIDDRNRCATTNRVFAQMNQGITLCLKTITTIVQGHKASCQSFWGEYYALLKHNKKQTQQQLSEI